MIDRFKRSPLLSQTGQFNPSGRQAENFVGNKPRFFMLGLRFTKIHDSSRRSRE